MWLAKATIVHPKQSAGPQGHPTPLIAKATTVPAVDAGPSTVAAKAGAYQGWGLRLLRQSLPMNFMAASFTVMWGLFRYVKA